MNNLATWSEDLEQRVVARTRELAATNTTLRREIAHRKQAEETLRRNAADLAEAQRLAHIGNWTLDLNTGAVTWSDELYRIFGIEKENFGGRYDAFLSRIHGDDRARVLETNAQAKLEGSSFEIEYRIVTPNGELKTIREVGYADEDEAGNVHRLFGTAQDITERKRAEEQLQATSDQLRALSVRLQSAREEEGSRIARELHDELGSALTSLKWDLESIQKACSESPTPADLSKLSQRVAEMMALVDATMNTVRRVSSELRPSVLDDVGVLAAIEWQAHQFQSRSGIPCSVDTLVEGANLDGERATAIFRILQEAMTNILRHARATRVNVTVTEDAGHFVLEIRDNGRGISDDELAAPRSIGLLGMRERARLAGGAIEVKGAADKGTVVTVRIPLSR